MLVWIGACAVVGPLAGDRLVAPGEPAQVGAPRGLLPFGLRRQPLADPVAVGVGPVPVHVDDGVVVVGRVGVVVRTGGGTVGQGMRTGPGHLAGAVLGVGNLRAVDVEGVEIDGVDGACVVVAETVAVVHSAAHRKRAGRDEDLLGERLRGSCGGKGGKLRRGAGCGDKEGRQGSRDERQSNPYERTSRCGHCSLL